MDFMSLITNYPKISIIILASAISFLISLVNHFVLDKESMRSLKARQKEIQEQIKKHQKDGNDSKVMELNKEFMSTIGQTFKHSFKPMLYTAIPILVFFGFIRASYAETAIAGSWFWWYLLGAIGSSILFRKVFNNP